MLSVRSTLYVRESPTGCVDAVCGLARLDCDNGKPELEHHLQAEQVLHGIVLHRKGLFREDLLQGLFGR